MMILKPGDKVWLSGIQQMETVTRVTAQGIYVENLAGYISLKDAEGKLFVVDTNFIKDLWQRAGENGS